MQLTDLKMQALRYLALGEVEQAFLVYRAILRQVPADLDARMKVADTLVHAGLTDLARRVYAAVAWCDLQSGRPLHALVCSQALADLGQADPAIEAAIQSIRGSLATLYGADSDRLGRKGGAPRDADPDPLERTEITEVDLTALPGALAGESTAEIAADTETFGPLPQTLRPIPLLSELPAAGLLRLLPGLLVRRLPPRTAVLEEGNAGFSLFFVAGGAVDALRAPPEGPRTALQRLGEGSLFGASSLIHPGSTGHRWLRLETAEPCELVEAPVRWLRQHAEQDALLHRALNRLCADRLLRLLLHRSPLFQPLTPGQREELQGRFVATTLDPEEVLVRVGEVLPRLHVVVSGELEALSGDEPFSALLGRLNPGDVHGEGGLLQPGPSPVTLRAVQPTTVYSLTHDAFARLCHTVPPMAPYLAELPGEVTRALHAPARSLLLPLPAPGDDDEADVEALLL